MVNPDVGRSLDANAISVCREDVLADDVTNDHIGLFPYIKSNTDEFFKNVRSLTSSGRIYTY